MARPRVFIITQPEPGIVCEECDGELVYGPCDFGCADEMTVTLRVGRNVGSALCPDLETAEVVRVFQYDAALSDEFQIVFSYETDPEVKSTILLSDTESGWCWSYVIHSDHLPATAWTPEIFPTFGTTCSAVGDPILSPNAACGGPPPGPCPHKFLMVLEFSISGPCEQTSAICSGGQVPAYHCAVSDVDEG